MQNQAIQVKGLQKSYKKLHVLRGVDFEVERGSIFALLGSNGAGKTTIVKILTTLLEQDSGTAAVNGFDVASKPDDVRQSISLTGQFAAVDEILTGRENLIMIARLRHLKDPLQVSDGLLSRFSLTDAADRSVSTYSGVRSEEPTSALQSTCYLYLLSLHDALPISSKPDDVRQSISLTGQFAAVDEILTGRENLIMIARLRHLKDPLQVSDGLLSRFSLTDAADRSVSTYSGGMRRRLDIAMSLVGSPQVIFLDEPTTGLDPEGRIEVWKIVKELADNGTTVFLTTQYLEEAEQLADRIAILHQGKIIANGTLADLKKLFPPAKVEYVEKQPTLEEIFLAIIGKKEKK